MLLNPVGPHVALGGVALGIAVVHLIFKKTAVSQCMWKRQLEDLM